MRTSGILLPNQQRLSRLSRLWSRLYYLDCRVALAFYVHTGNQVTFDLDPLQVIIADILPYVAIGIGIDIADTRNGIAAEAQHTRRVPADKSQAITVAILDGKSFGRSSCLGGHTLRHCIEINQEGIHRIRTHLGVTRQLGIGIIILAGKCVDRR